MSEQPQVVVHEPGDNVGVVVVEDAKAGQELTGWVMAGDQTIRVEAKADIPLGHKIALRPIASGETIVKYDHDIGQAVADIEVGGYVHAHNIKTKRW